MELKVQIINKNLKEYAEVKRLIHTAFPTNEQLPMWLLQIMSLRKTVDFLAYYDDGIFCGISYTIETKNAVFILYLAVNDKIRSKGYGSAIVQSIKKMYGIKHYYLNVEPVNTSADNYTQRVKRIEFYKKNGFYTTNYHIVDGKIEYLILSTEEKFLMQEYKKVVKKLAFGFYSPKIQYRGE